MTDYALLRQILNTFGFHAPQNDENRKAHTELRSMMIATGLVLAMLPAGRERSLAITKLEESAMWAHKALAINMGPVELNELSDEVINSFHDLIVGIEDKEYPRASRIAEIKEWLAQATRFGLSKGNLN